MNERDRNIAACIDLRYERIKGTWWSLSNDPQIMGGEHFIIIIVIIIILRQHGQRLGLQQVMHCPKYSQYKE